jgi:hypothetical protein
MTFTRNLHCFEYHLAPENLLNNILMHLVLEYYKRLRLKKSYLIRYRFCTVSVAIKLNNRMELKLCFNLKCTMNFKYAY